MPHPAILAELGMTAAEWGLIRDENERTKLKNEAAEKILARRAEAEQNSLANRLKRLEDAVFGDTR